MFSERLNQILTSLDVTSWDLARFAVCDKPYISRMTSGASALLFSSVVIFFSVYVLPLSIPGSNTISRKKQKSRENDAFSAVKLKIPGCHIIRRPYLYFFQKTARIIFTFSFLCAIICKDESEAGLCFHIKVWSKN